MILGIDIGGANTKITKLNTNNSYTIDHIYFPMWMKNNELINLLSKYNNNNNKISKIALVTTAELADAYKTKKEGIENILNSVEEAFPNKEIYIFDVNGNFLTVEEGKKKYMDISASNWTATTEFIKKEFNLNDFLLIDMGSTTTDIIPVINGNIVANKTDLDRLINKELLYVGTLRTPVSFLTNEIIFKGIKTNMSSEYFAITGDINIIMNKISENEYSCDTPDGKPANKEHCKIRLSKVICSDLEQITNNEIENLAFQLYEKLINLIKYNISFVLKKYNNINNIVITGLGEPILLDALKLLNENKEYDGINNKYNIISIKDKYNKDISLATPSFAVAKLLSYK